MQGVRPPLRPKPVHEPGMGRPGRPTHRSRQGLSRRSKSASRWRSSGGNAGDPGAAATPSPGRSPVLTTAHSFHPSTSLSRSYDGRGNGSGGSGSGGGLRSDGITTTAGLIAWGSRSSMPRGMHSPSRPVSSSRAVTRPYAPKRNHPLAPHQLPALSPVLAAQHASGGPPPLSSPLPAPLDSPGKGVGMTPTPPPGAANPLLTPIHHH